jgi:DMSO/TMAO reductase YedYZ molybdopterin-dependent catalytic subunit
MPFVCVDSWELIVVTAKVPMKEKRRFNTTTPAAELDAFITPFEKLFTVFHMGIPMTDEHAWRLSVGGLVQRPLTLSLADLRTLPSTEVCAVHECAGSPLRPTVPVRRVANVTWKGVRLKTVLDLAGVLANARYAWSRGADGGIYPPTGTHSDSYQKDMPIEKAMHEDVLLATEVNGAALSEMHGAPLRLVVPGYYGTNSVKWLTEITLADTRADNFYTTTLYNDRVMEDGVERTKPVWDVAPNSIIVAPCANVAAGQPSLVWGWAWSASDIASVQVSMDGGTTWHAASLDQRRDQSWRRFSIAWTTIKAGIHELVSCATDCNGMRQPDHGARNETFKVSIQAE